jgi:hypothetical protein
MCNSYIHNEVETLVTYDWNVTEQSERRAQPIYQFNFYIERRGTITDYWTGSNNRKGFHVVNTKKKVITVNSYMTSDEIRLMKELILDSY